YAVTTAVAAFFAGLALGGLLFGRLVDRVSRPLRLYVALELGIALLGGLATFALAHTPPLFAAAEERVGVVAWALPFFLVGVPAVLMGGTLPVLFRAQAPKPAQLSRVGGCFYAANTAGAVVGALLTPFALLPRFGVQRAAFVAVATNI